MDGTIELDGLAVYAEEHKKTWPAAQLQAQEVVR